MSKQCCINVDATLIRHCSDVMGFGTAVSCEKNVTSKIFPTSLNRNRRSIKSAPWTSLLIEESHSY